MVSSSPIFIFGSGRSGTSWLASILASHPECFHLHEPDSVCFSDNMPYLVHDPQHERWRRPANEFLDRLTRVKALRAVGKRPFFAKRYRGRVAAMMRNGVISAALAADRLLPLAKMPVPDLCDRDNTQIVMKSVDSVARLPAFAIHCPEVRFIYIRRHPCGIFNSQQKGIELGKMTPPRLYQDQLALPFAQKLGLSLPQIETLSIEAVSAYSWAIINDYAWAHVRECANVYPIIYEELCADPIGVAGKLFRWCGMTLEPQTEAFLGSSLKAQGDSSQYHGLIRQPTVAASKWRTQLTPHQIKVIEDIAAQTLAFDPFVGEATPST